MKLCNMNCDEAATKTAIIKQLKNSIQSSQRDGLAFEGEQYFLPHETELKEDQDYFTKVGVSQYTQRHFSRGLSKTAGVVVLAATRKDQEAAELSDLGHGLFTYLVAVEGMIGKADLKPVNNIISTHEISDFSTANIPLFSKKYLGASQ